MDLPLRARRGARDGVQGRPEPASPSHGDGLGRPGPTRAVAAPRDRPAGTRPRPLDPWPAGRLDRRQLRGRERAGHRRDVRGPLGEGVMRTPKPAGPAPRAPSVAPQRTSPLVPAYGRLEKGAPRGA